MRMERGYLEYGERISWAWREDILGMERGSAHHHMPIPLNSSYTNFTKLALDVKVWGLGSRVYGIG